MRPTVFGLAALALLSAVAGPARADLVVNGGFETGDFTGWTTTGNFIEIGNNTTNNIGGFGAHSGNFYAALGTVGGLGTVTQSQTIATTAGQDYTLSFWLASDGGIPNEFQARWDGVAVFDQTQIPQHGYINYTFTVTGTGSDTLTFAERDDPGFLSLDDVSLVPVPEPASATLLGLGALGLMGYARWRRKPAAV